MTTYAVKMAGQEIATFNTKEEAEKALTEVRNSIFGLVHPREAFWIEEK